MSGPTSLPPVPHAHAAGAVMLGGACGAMARYALNACIMTPIIAHWGATAFPIGIFCINLLGGLGMGLLQGVLARQRRPPLLQPLLATGFLGGFTTFSTFAVDTLRLGQYTGLLPALGNVAASVVLCTGAALLGLRLASPAPPLPEKGSASRRRADAS